MNVHVFALLPPLEQAPDQIASRPLETLSVIEVPAANVADPVLPTATLIPAGVDKTRSPLLPVAFTVSVAEVAAGAVVASGLTVSTAERVTPPPETEIVTAVCEGTDVVKMLNPPVVEPAGIVTPFGTDATAGLLLVT